MEEEDVPAFFQVSSCDGNKASELIVCVQCNRGTFQQRSRLWMKRIYLCDFLSVFPIMSTLFQSQLNHPPCPSCAITQRARRDLGATLCPGCARAKWAKLQVQSKCSQTCRAIHNPQLSSP